MEATKMLLSATSTAGVFVCQIQQSAVAAHDRRDCYFIGSVTPCTQQRTIMLTAWPEMRLYIREVVLHAGLSRLTTRVCAAIGPHVAD
jgi:hypothetical protein